MATARAVLFMLAKYITTTRYNHVNPHVTGEALDLGCGFSFVPDTFRDLPTYVGVDRLDTPLLHFRSLYPNYTFLSAI